jgi:RNA-directed DNA polymerase
VKSDRTASDHRLRLAAKNPQEEAVTGKLGHTESIQPQALLARVLERENLQRALKRVRQNQGAPGIDGMTVGELNRRGHRFARYADDCNSLVRSKRAGERVMASISRFLSDTLRLPVNPLKSAVDRPAQRKFLGFTVSRQGIRLKAQIRRLTRRTRGRRLRDIVAELSDTLLGWKAYFGIAEVLSPLRDIDKWIRRKLRCHIWKQWGRAGYRELRKRGVTVRDAWHTSKSAHGPWRLSKTPALALALPVRYFSNMGLPALAAR